MNSDSQFRYFLFARPTFAVGLGSIWDLGNGLFMFNDSPNGKVADYLAMKNDWMVVGEDIQEAITKYAVPDEQLELLPSSGG